MIGLVKAMSDEKASQLTDSSMGKDPISMTQEEFMLYIQTYDAETIAETPEEYFRLLEHHGIYR